jgi:hypothetical protein
MKSFSQCSRSLGRDLNHKPPEYEAGWPRRSAKEMLNTKNVINGEISLDKYFLFYFGNRIQDYPENLCNNLFLPIGYRKNEMVHAKNVPLREAMLTK